MTSTCDTRVTDFLMGELDPQALNEMESAMRRDETRRAEYRSRVEVLRAFETLSECAPRPRSGGFARLAARLDEDEGRGFDTDGDVPRVFDAEPRAATPAPATRPRTMPDGRQVALRSWRAAWSLAAAAMLIALALRPWISPPSPIGEQAALPGQDGPSLRAVDQEARSLWAEHARTRADHALFAGDRLVLGENECRLLRLGDSFVELAPHTELIIENAGRLRLLRGELWGDTRPDAGAKLTIETPEGRVSVTGTRFGVLRPRAGEVSVLVLRGAVRFTPRGEAQVHKWEITAGHSVSTASGARSEVRDLTEVLLLGRDDRPHLADMHVVTHPSLWRGLPAWDARNGAKRYQIEVTAEGGLPTRTALVPLPDSGRRERGDRVTLSFDTRNLVTAPGRYRLRAVFIQGASERFSAPLDIHIPVAPR